MVNDWYLKISKKFNLLIVVGLLLVYLVGIISKGKYLFVYLGISLLSVIGLLYYFLKKEKGLMYNHRKYLFHLLIPKSIYLMNNIDLGNFRIDNLLFNHREMFIMDCFHLKGDLKGSRTQHLLEFQEAQKIYSRKIKNPIKTVLFKADNLKQIMRLYHINLKIQPILYFPSTTWKEDEKETLKDEILIYGVKGLEKWIKGCRDYKMKAIKHHQMMDVIYMLMSIRYYEYLRSFYCQLSSSEKINLKKQLSTYSLTLLEFVVLKDAFKFEKLNDFIKKNHSHLQQGMRSWQEQLFFELNEIMISNQDAGFMPFNFVGLMLSEGFCIDGDLSTFCLA